MKILKQKVGEIYKDGATLPIYKTYWEKKSEKTGKKYFEAKDVIFVGEVEQKPKTETVKEGEL